MYLIHRRAAGSWIKWRSEGVTDLQQQASLLCEHGQLENEMVVRVVPRKTWEMLCSCFPDTTTPVLLEECLPCVDCAEQRREAASSSRQASATRTSR